MHRFFLILCIILSMSSNFTSAIIKQKKIARGLKGSILALISLIGILKISLGAVINVPIAFLFGDLFVGFFGLLIILAFYLILFPFPKKKRRTIIVFLSFFGLLILGSTLYAGLLSIDFKITPEVFNESLATMVDKSRDAFSFTAPKNQYFYAYGGLIGEGILLLLAPLSLGLIATIIAFLALLLLIVIFWPSIKRFVKYLKEYMREKQKRQKVLFEAGLLGEEEEKEEVIKVQVDESEDTHLYKSSLLHPVTSRFDDQGHTNHEPISTSPTLPKKEPVTGGLQKVTEEDFADTPLFDLPTLDNEDTIEAVIKTPVLDAFSRVDTDDYETIQKAVMSSGTFEAVVAPPINEEIIEEDVAETTIEEETVVKEDAELSPLPLRAESVGEEIVEAETLPQNETIKEAEKPKERIKKKYLNYKFPDINLLSDPVEDDAAKENEAVALDFSERINGFFRDFNIDAVVASWTIGSSFTRYEISLGPTETINSFKNLMNDISLRLNGSSIRFEPIIPGKALSGIEVANKHRTIVNFKESMQRINKEKKKKYYVPMGKDVSGNIIFSSFADFPHLLVAGATGSGKSVFIHTLLTALIMNHSPVELRLLLIDPKRVELAQYANIPHLLTPIIKEPSEAKVALDRLIDEMERRYKLFETTTVSKFSDYNEVIEEMGGEKLPLIIAILDEFADLFESEKEVASGVLRLVQKSRAAGIHLLIATQRPSVQVITGNIKANIPSRVAFMTSSAVDSTTILGQGGAETLLGYGDMLVDSITVGRGFVRVQAPFIPVKEVLRITNFLRNNYEPDFHPDFLDLKEKVQILGPGGPVDDELYPHVLAYTETQDTISISRLQQQFGLGWPRARSLYDLLIHNGVIEPPEEGNSAKGATVIINRNR